ncbi:MAG: T9SS type A sorting domain-containing protein [Calditrichaeota bacterium]|nr:T9SS type A sorting domain-containing protein [Calditrichota bacterium]
MRLSKTSLILLISLKVFGQDFFPLESNNSWSYMVLHPDQNYNIDTSYYRLDVLGDSLFPNGHSYWNLRFRDMLESTQFVRADTGYIHIISILNGESIPFFNLRSLPGSRDSITAGGYDMFVNFRREYQTTILGESAIAREYYWGYLTQSDATFIEGFGLSRATFYGDGEWPYHSRWLLIGCQIGDSTYGEIVGVKRSQNVSQAFRLNQNYPNPFNSTTIIRFSLREADEIQLSILNVRGQKVAELLCDYLTSGEYEVAWEANEVASGVYFCQLKSNNYVSTKKMLLLR